MYAIFTEDGLDQVVETKAIARREATDLGDMGCKVWVYSYPASFDMEAWADETKGSGKRPSKRHGAKLEITRGEW